MLDPPVDPNEEGNEYGDFLYHIPFTDHESDALFAHFMLLAHYCKGAIEASLKSTVLISFGLLGLSTFLVLLIDVNIHMES